MVRILFVDDEPNILQGLERMLRSMRKKWDMSFATSGFEALEILAKEPFDIIVTDIRMPQMDGIELLEQVAQKYPGMTRFILSGQAKQETIIRAIGPMHQYLTKPTESDTLKSAIERSIALRSILTDEKLKGIISCIRSLPSLPDIYNELMKHLEQEEPSFAKIGKIISKDISMTAQILHLVNSTYYGFSHQVSNINQAITLLGIDTIRVLLISVHAFSMINEKILNVLPLSSLWDHSINTSNIARVIAQEQKFNKRCEDYSIMGAILHDIGILILANNFTDKYVEIVQKSMKQSTPFYELEYNEFGVSHAEVGGYLLGIWGLPDPIVETVCYHHTPEKSLISTCDHVMAVYAANIIEYEITDNIQFDRKVTFNENYISQCHITDHINIWREKAQQINLMRNNDE